MVNILQVFRQNSNAHLCMALNTVICTDGSVGLFYKKNIDDNATAS